MSELGDKDKLSRRKKRLQGLLGKPEAFADGGEVENLKEHEPVEDEFLSSEDNDSEVEPDELAKRKERLARISQPRFGKKK